MDPFKHVTQKRDLFYHNIAGGGKIMHMLGEVLYAFGLTDNRIDMAKIYLFKKKSKVFLQLKKFVTKLKA